MMALYVTIAPIMFLFLIPKTKAHIKELDDMLEDNTLKKSFIK